MTTFPGTMTPRRRAVPEDAHAAPVEPEAPLFADPQSAAYDPPAVDRRPLALATLHYHGVPVQLDIRAIDSQALASVEKRIDRLLGREGWAAPPAPAAAAPAVASKPAELRQEPFYRSDGTACCPIHKSPLQESKFGGFFCGSKAEPPIGSERGYCRYSWKD